MGQLPCGGDLRISEGGWSISYYFPGPDRRYNGTLIEIPGDQIQRYIDALRLNLTEYVRLKTAAPPGTELSKGGLMEMTIRVGGFAEGVCLRFFHMPVASHEEAEQLIASWEAARQQALQLTELLRSPAPGLETKAFPPGPPQDAPAHVLNTWVDALADVVLENFPLYDDARALREVKVHIKSVRGFHEHDLVWDMFGIGVILRARARQGR